MRRLIPLLFSALLLVLAPGWAPAGFEHRPLAVTRQVSPTAAGAVAISQAKTAVAPPRTVAQATPAAEPLADYTLHLPADAATRQPLRILVALHGMGGNGTDFAKPLVPFAEDHGWAVLAPTMPYRDYRDPELVRRDGELHPRLKALIDALPDRTGLTFMPKVLLYGFSRGSQESHRFSLMYPESTLGVAGMSAGSYTLPSTTFKQTSGDEALNYPFGTGDVEKFCGRAFNPEAAQKISYWIAVGARDIRSEDIPREWDRYVGSTRVERAQRFVTALQQFGANAQLAIFPNAGHEVTPEMQDAALNFLHSLPS